MKKMWLLLLVVSAAFVLTACQPREYAADGDYTAYAVGTHNGPQVTTVTVTIEDDEIVGFYIDTRQGGVDQTAGADTPDDDSDDTYEATWNTQTKKELLDAYGMAAIAGGLEWYEQAEALEAHWLANGVTLDDVDSEGNTDAVTGVSITVDEYYDLALEAIQNAKDGVFEAVYCTEDSHGPALYSATMSVEDGSFSDLVIDVLQSSLNDSNEFVWDTQTKWEKGDDYGMAAVAGGLEWFEQSEEIAEFVEANGWTSSTSLDGITGVSITTDGFSEVLDVLFALAEAALD